jgi:hypothetical protein
MAWLRTPIIWRWTPVPQFVALQCAPQDLGTNYLVKSRKQNIETSKRLVKSWLFVRAYGEVHVHVMSKDIIIHGISAIPVQETLFYIFEELEIFIKCTQSRSTRHGKQNKWTQTNLSLRQCDHIYHIPTRIRGDKMATREYLHTLHDTRLLMMSYTNTPIAFVI